MKIIKKNAVLLFAAIVLISLAAGCGNTSSPGEEASVECNISVSCGKALASEKLAAEKKQLLPSDGIIACEKMNVSPSTNAFDVFKSLMMKNNIQYEASSSPVYIRGIDNLYELDCGGSSGWLYKVNGSIPDVSCADYIIKSGDEIEFFYTDDFNSEF